jgi:hypothetical protein
LVAYWLWPESTVPSGITPIFAVLDLPPSSRRRHHHTTEAVVVVAIAGRVMIAIRRQQMSAVVVVEGTATQHTGRLAPAPLHPGGSHQRAGFTTGTNLHLEKKFRCAARIS